jgi:hypothetical protein
MEALVQRMIDEAFHTLTQGTPARKDKMLATILPAVLRSTTQDESTQIILLREDMNAIQREVRKQLLPPVITPAVVIPEDVPDPDPTDSSTLDS